MLIPVKGPITEPFKGKRPLYLREKLEKGTITDNELKKMHPHGAIDIASSVGKKIVAPETGIAFIYQGMRPNKNLNWPHEIKLNNNKIDFPFKNYFYDVFGTIIVLKVPHVENIEHIERTHVIAHMYGNQGFNKAYKDVRKIYKEEKKQCRFPITCWYTKEIMVKQGDLIGYVGNSGYTTGAHIHWEIHHGYGYEKHSDRIDPEKYIGG